MGSMAAHDPSQEATESDGLNTPPMMPDEPTWMTDVGGSADSGDSSGMGAGLGWRGGRRSSDGERHSSSMNSSRGRTLV